MKKLIAIIAVMFLMTAYAKADKRGVPTARGPDALATADYGGVNFDTLSFSTGTSFIGAGEHVVNAVFFSSATSGFVVFRDTDTNNSTSTEAFRVYHDTSSNNNDGQSGTLVKLPYPVRFKNGVVWDVSTAVFNAVTVLFTKDAENTQ